MCLMSDYLGNPSHLFLRSTAHNGLSGMMQDLNAVENLTMAAMVMMMVTMMMMVTTMVMMMMTMGVNREWETT